MQALAGEQTDFDLSLIEPTIIIHAEGVCACLAEMRGLDIIRAERRVLVVVVGSEDGAIVQEWRAGVYYGGAGSIPGQLSDAGLHR